MNRLIWALVICVGITACGGNGAGRSDTTKEEQTQEELQAAKERVEILYFHGRQRCATCMAIEKSAREVVETQFADELKNGTIVFKAIDISKAGNEAMAEKYEVTWSSLFLSRWRNGVETYENLTGYAFANARTASDTFKKGLATKIRELQK